MKFAYPEFLFALSVISIPIIIHLFNFRRFKKIYFSDIRFLKEIKEQTQNRNRMKHLLVLLCRILAFAFLVFAFARPFIPGPGGEKLKGKKAISVYIDNSYSMAYTEKEGEPSLFEKSKQRAFELARNAEKKSLWSIYLFNESIQPVLVGAHSKNEFLDTLKELHVSHIYQ